MPLAGMPLPHPPQRIRRLSASAAVFVLFSVTVSTPSLKAASTLFSSTLAGRLNERAAEKKKKKKKKKKKNEGGAAELTAKKIRTALLKSQRRKACSPLLLLLMLLFPGAGDGEHAILHGHLHRPSCSRAQPVPASFTVTFSVLPSCSRPRRGHSSKKPCSFCLLYPCIVITAGNATARDRSCGVGEEAPRFRQGSRGPPPPPPPPPPPSARKPSLGKLSGNSPAPTYLPTRSSSTDFFFFFWKAGQQPRGGKCVGHGG